MAATHPRWMNESHIVFEDAATKFFEAELVPNIDKWREAGVVDKAFWRKAGEAGLMGGSIPEEFGGMGLRPLANALVQMELGESYLGALSLNTQGPDDATMLTLLEHGTDEQCGAHLPVIVLTARKEEFDELDTLARGADDFVTKPFDPDYLALVGLGLFRQ